MLTKVLPIKPLPSKFVEQLKQIDDFYVCTSFTEDMIGPPIARIKDTVYFRFMNFIYSPQPPESLPIERAKKICDIRLEYIDELVNYELNSAVVNSIAECVAAKHSTSTQLMKALDFGCGDGLSSRMLLKQIPNLDLVGVDISEKAIVRCQERNIKAELIAVDKPLPFKSAAFDSIFAVFVMHFDVDLKMLGELRRILRPSGLFIFNVYQKDTDELNAQLEEVGFCTIELWERLSNIGNNHAVVSCRSTDHHC